MTPEITTTLIILGLAVLLFVTERVRVDLVALLVLGALALTGLVTPEEALSGFSSPAVVTVWAVFIISSGLSRTGIANLLGRQMRRFGGRNEVRLMVIIMLSAGVLSAFMNNVGVTAMMLPVVIDVARRTRRPPSKLLIPLAFGSLLGGMTTLIGTPPNILASDILGDFGLRPFDLFDYAWVGVPVMLVGILYMALIGRRLLPARTMTQDFAKPEQDPGKVFKLQERLFVIRLPEDSTLAGKTLAQSRLGSALSLNVIGILRNGDTELAPEPSVLLRSGDRLLVTGRLDRLADFGNGATLRMETNGEEDVNLTIEDLTSTQIEIAEVGLTQRSAYLGHSIAEIEFRQRFGPIVLAIGRKTGPIRTDFQDIPLQHGDTLLVQATQEQLDFLRNTPNFLVSKSESAEVYRLQERLHLFAIPQASTLAGKTLTESHLGDAFGLGVMGVIREGETQLMPDPDMQIRAGDKLIIKGKVEDIQVLRGLQNLEVDAEAIPELSELESERVGLVEVALSPHTTLVGKTLRQINFREKYGLNILAIWRGGEAYRFDLRDMALRFGDALLVYGRRDRVRVLGSEADFLVLAGEAQTPPRKKKAPLAAIILGGVVLSVMLGWLPISIAAVVGATLMVTSGCLNMEEAYRSIHWQVIFLIAGMLPLGIAMQNSGAAQFLAEGVVNLTEPLGPMALAAGLYTLTLLASQVMPNPVVIVLMAPIALSAASHMDLSPYAMIMLVAVAASTTFLSPVGHPSNILVMGPGGYRFRDYVKVGLPLTIILMVVTLLVLPLFWPLMP